MITLIHKLREQTRNLLAESARSERGFSALQTVTSLAIAASLGGLVSMNSTEMVGAAEATTCQYEYTIIETAVDAYSLTSDDMNYPVPAGVDGLDAVREERLLRKTSTYWRYTGVDDKQTPQFELAKPVEGCRQ